MWVCIASISQIFTRLLRRFWMNRAEDFSNNAQIVVTVEVEVTTLTLHFSLYRGIDDIMELTPSIKHSRG